MNLFLAVTDNDWFRFLRSRAPLDEVNFWRPGGEAGFRALHPGEPLLFKLDAPENFVVGGGFFSHFSREVPVSLAWDAFGEANGAPSFGEMRRRIEKYRRIQPAPHEDYRIGCILLSQPFFFDESEWVWGGRPPPLRRRLRDRDAGPPVPGEPTAQGRFAIDLGGGEPYDPFDGDEIRLPPDPREHPKRELLEWHGDVVFRG